MRCKDVWFINYERRIVECVSFCGEWPFPQIDKYSYIFPFVKDCEELFVNDGIYCICYQTITQDMPQFKEYAKKFKYEKPFAIGDTKRNRQKIREELIRNGY